MKKLRAVASALCALIIALTVAATPAVAISAYCDDLVSPVTLSVSWKSHYEMKAVTSAPINSTAKLYAEPNSAGPYVLVAQAHYVAGTNLTITYATSTPGKFVILNYGDVGQVWYDGNGTRDYCRSPIRTLDPL